MMWNLQSYPTTVLNERMWHFMGASNILWPLLHIFRGVKPPTTSRICATICPRNQKSIPIRFFSCWSRRPAGRPVSADAAGANEEENYWWWCWRRSDEQTGSYVSATTERRHQSASLLRRRRGFLAHLHMNRTTKARECPYVSLPVPVIGLLWPHPVP